MLGLLILAAAFAEVVSLGSVLPLLAVLSEPERLWSMPLVNQTARIVGLAAPSDLLVPVAAAFALAALSAAFIRLANLWLGGQLAASVGSDLSFEAYKRTLYQPYSIHVQRNSSSVINSITKQVAGTVVAINAFLLSCTSIFIVVSLLIVLFLVDWAVALSLFILFGLVYVLFASATKKVLASNGEIVDANSVQSLKSLHEGLGAIREVLLDGTQSTYLKIYSSSDRPLRQALALNQFLGMFPRFALEALGLIALACLAIALVYQKGIGAPSLTILGAFALGAQRLLPAMQQSYTGWSQLQGYKTDLAGLLETLKQPLPQSINVNYDLALEPHIVFSNVSFSYGSGKPFVLREMSLEIKAGQRIGFIGSTGSGKSTTVDLLMGLLVPSQGQIYVDGLDLHDAAHPERLLSWRSAIAHVPQSIYLSDSSVAENIAFGVPGEKIDFERVKLAAQQAQIASFIESSSGGYDSFVGERGIRLSGGQRQRIGIARALYKRAQILILDEATSALDNQTEQAVIDAIDHLDRNLTVVMIAHRLSTIAKCDRVIRLDQGHVVADGPPHAVLPQA